MVKAIILVFLALAVCQAFTIVSTTRMAFKSPSKHTSTGSIFMVSGEGSEVEKDEADSGRKHDMTDRFKYSVNALMGTYDPIGDDDERQDGNILSAMIHFPANFTFNAVGKTNGDKKLQDEYVDEVKSVFLSICGDSDATFEVLPRGKKFTKVKCELEVQSATMVNTIFEDIAKLEKTLMHF